MLSELSGTNLLSAGSMIARCSCKCSKEMHGRLLRAIGGTKLQDI
jgi:hypothetical protein